MTPWLLRDGLLHSPLLESVGVVAAFTTRALGPRDVEVSGICTRCGAADLWSYRGQGRKLDGSGLAVVGRAL